MQLLQRDTMRVIALAFSPDGHLLASCSIDGTSTVWDTHTGEGRVLPEVRLEGGRPLFVYDEWQQLAFTPDGCLLLHRSPTYGLLVWNLIENRVERTLLPPITLAYQSGLTFAPVSGLGAANANEWVPERSGNAIILWDSATWQRRVLYRTSERYGFSGLAFDPSGTRLATNVGVFDTTTSAQLVDAHLWGDVLEWSPTAPLIAGAGNGREIEIFHATTGEPLTALQLAETGSPRFAFSPTGAHLAVVNGHGVQVWETEHWMQQSEFEWGIGWLNGLAFSRDGLRAACGGSAGQILIWDWDL